MNSVFNLDISKIPQSIVNDVRGSVLCDKIFKWNGHNIEDVAAKEGSLAAIKELRAKISSCDSNDSASSDMKTNLNAVLKSLDKTTNKIAKIKETTQKFFPDSSHPGDQPTELKSILSHINSSDVADHPAFRQGWSRDIAEEVLKLNSIPVGAFVMIEADHNQEGEDQGLEKEDIRYKLLIKSDANQVLTCDMDTSGEKVTLCNDWKEEQSLGGSTEEYQAPVRSENPPECLEMQAMTAPDLSHELIYHLEEHHALLEAKQKFASFESMSFQETFKDMAKESNTTRAKDNRLQRENVRENLLSAVDEINVAPHTKVQLSRNNEEVFFHGNKVSIEGQTFICHQLPTDYSRDDLWLSVWNEIGEGHGNRTTIVKLSTEECPQSNVIPTLRPYWPLGQSSKGIDLDEFKKRCETTENVLNGKIKEFEAAIENNKKEIQSITEKIDSLDSKQQAVAKRKLLALNESLNANNVRINSAKEHLKFIHEQKSNETGDLVGSFKTRDNISVKIIEEKNIDMPQGAQLRKFSLIKEGENQTRYVTQIDYPHWKDFQSTSVEQLIHLRNTYLEEHGANPVPAYVHCRAGVGRTGTLVAFLALTTKIDKARERGELNSIDPKKDLFEIVSTIRSQRDQQMVQTMQQAHQIVSAATKYLDDLIKKSENNIQQESESLLKNSD